MTTMISRQERVDFYNSLNDLTRLLASMDETEYRTGEHVEMAKIINGLRIRLAHFTTIQEDVLRLDAAGISRVDNSYSHLFDDCERHGLYLGEDCPGCQNEEAGHPVDPWEEEKEERAREIREEQKAGGAT